MRCRSRKSRIRKKHNPLFSRRSLPGSAPGTLIVDPSAPKPAVRLIAFGPDQVEEERVYLRDCYDHMVQIIDLLENYRDATAGLMEVYLSSISNRTNEIVKVLTIIAAVFVPLTLIAGIYGMNFDTNASPWNMPELKWVLGYPFALGVMALVALILLLYFRIKGWLGKSN